MLRYCFGDMLFHRCRHFICLRHTHRRKRSHYQHYCVPSVLGNKHCERHGAEMKKAVIILIICIGMLVGCSNNSVPINTPSETTDITSLVNSTEPAATGNSQSSETAEELASHPEVPLEASSGDVFEIKEKLFIAQTNDIYYNADDYLGKTIKYEGIYKAYPWEEENNLTYYYVIRYGPGCCGNDGEAGFEIIWNGEHPNEDDWVEAIGVLEEYEEDGYKYLRLVLTSLTVLPTRGAEYVSQ